MLVLARTPYAYIRLTHKKTGEVIRLCPVKMGRGTVRIGIEAGSDWTILREELLNADSDDNPNLKERIHRDQ